MGSLVSRTSYSKILILCVLYERKGKWKWKWEWMNEGSGNKRYIHSHPKQITVYRSIRNSHSTASTHISFHIKADSIPSLNARISKTRSTHLPVSITITPICWSRPDQGGGSGGGGVCMAWIWSWQFWNIPQWKMVVFSRRGHSAFGLKFLSSRNVDIIPSPAPLLSTEVPPPCENRISWRVIFWRDV